RRPPVRGRKLELFGVDPVELAVEEGGGSITREPGHVLVRDLESIEVVFAAEADTAPVGRELRIALGVGGDGELISRAGGEAIEKELPASSDEELLARPGPLYRLLPYATVPPVERFGRRRCSCLLFQLVDLHELASGSSRDLVEPDCTALYVDEAL